jgi:hypothetical protein
MTTTIAKVQTPDRNLNKIQDNIKLALSPLTGNKLFFGNLLTNVSLASGANSINHGLGYPLSGWYMTRIRASASFYDTQDSNPTPSTTLQIVASAAAVVDLWVF